MSFIAGDYTVTYNDVDIGVVEDGFELEFTQAYEDVRGDNLGDTLQDGIFRGYNATISAILLEANNAALRQAVWPFYTTAGNLTDWGVIGTLGVLATSKAKALVLTKIAGNPAADADCPKTLTASKAILARDFPVRLLFANRLRRIPIRFQLFAYQTDSVNRLFQITIA